MQRGPGHTDIVMTELRAAIAEQKLQDEGDICWVERELTALGGGEDPLQRDVEAVKRSIEALQRLEARRNREIQQLMTGMKRLEALMAEQQEVQAIADVQKAVGRLDVNLKF
jgi:chromosome segregation ATPase